MILQLKQDTSYLEIYFQDSQLPLEEALRPIPYVLNVVRRLLKIQEVLKGDTVLRVLLLQSVLLSWECVSD